MPAPRLACRAEHVLLALLPGSRASEVRQLAPIFLEVARRLAADRPELRLVMPVANDACRRVLEPLLTEYAALPLTLLYNDARTALTAADAVLVASGTATLETALLQRPMVVAYRMRALSALLVSRLLRTEYVALPNILAGRQLVPELLQGAATPEALLAAVEPLLDNPRKSAEMVAEFRAMRTSLAGDFAGESAGALMNLVLSKRGCPDGSGRSQLYERMHRVRLRTRADGTQPMSCIPRPRSQVINVLFSSCNLTRLVDVHGWVGNVNRDRKSPCGAAGDR
ncbi:MAG: hypothetical protein U5K56_06265 [Halioglobus sp.]|nr:hypothetical protein [Halioglobus sp.]